MMTDHRMTFAETARRHDEGGVKGRTVAALADARAHDGDHGGFTGYFATFGTLNAHCEIVLKGAYDKCAERMLRDGWVCPDHDWSVEKQVGMIQSTTADDKGQRVDIAFHSDDTAQRIRTRMDERLAHGKTVKLSYAFSVAPDGYRMMSGTEALEFLTNGTDEERERCRGLASVCVIHCVEDVFEVSIISAPSEMHADVLSVRSADDDDTDDNDTDGSDTALTPRRRSYNTERETLLADVRAFIERSREIHLELRAGRVLSGKNVERLTTIADALEAASKDVRTIIKEATPDTAGERASESASGTADETSANEARLRLAIARARIDRGWPDRALQ